MKYVTQEIKNAKLIIMGVGELQPYLKLLVEQLNLVNNIKLLGFKYNPFKYIKNSNLFIMSSISEDFGNVLIEAMDCSVTVISTDCRYGPREIFEPKSNFNLSQIK